MLKKNHALKVIIAFSGVIVLGLVSLVLIESFNEKEVISLEEDATVSATAQTPQTPPVKTLPTNTNNQNKAGTQKAKVR